MEFEVADTTGAPRGLVLAEVIGTKELASSKAEVIVVEPVAAQQAQVLEWAKEHLTGPAAIYVAPGPRLADYDDIGEGEDFVVMVVSRLRQQTRAAVEASWAGPGLALHLAAAEHERPPRRRAVAPSAPAPGPRPRRSRRAEAPEDTEEIVPPWRAPGLQLRQSRRERPPASELDSGEEPSADEDLDGELATSGELSRARRGNDATMDAVEDLRRRARATTAEEGGRSRIAGDGRPRIAGGRRRISLAPPPLLGGVSPYPGGDYDAEDTAARGAGPSWPPARLLPPGDSPLWPPGPGLEPQALLDQRGTPGPPADWGEKLARAFVERARAVHSGTASEEGLSVREILSLRSGRLCSSRTCRRLVKATEHPADLLPPEGPCFGEAKRRPRKRRKKEKSEGRRKSRKRRRRSSSSRSPSSGHSSASSDGTSESRERLFRTARDLGGFANRAQKMALVQPDRVLVESLAELSAILPATRPGASTSVLQWGVATRRRPSCHSCSSRTSR